MDSGRRARRGDLRALAYHQDVADRLERDDPDGWATVEKLHRIAPSGTAGWDDSGTAGWDDRSAEVDPAAQVLRSADRLDPQAHPVVRAALARAVENLGIGRPVAVYQGAEVSPEPLLRPDEIAVVLPGSLITRLPEAGLSAVLGQVLGRYRLWTLDEGRYRVADRLLELLGLDAAARPTHLATLRRYRLATAMFADRAAVVAGGDLRVAVEALVTAEPGLTETDTRIWALQQWSGELSAEPQDGSASTDALPAGETAARTRLRPGLDLADLDLFDRDDLERVTRALLEDILHDRRWCTEPVLAQAQQYFPDLTGSTSAGAWGSPSGAARPIPSGTSAPTRGYLGYVLLDLITADPDADVEAALARALRFAEPIGLGPDLDRLARTELPLSAAAWNRIAADR